MSIHPAKLRAICEHRVVANARPWRDRINIDVRGRAEFFRGKPIFKGEHRSRVSLRGNVLVIEKSVGQRSPEWDRNLAELIDWFGGQGTKISFRSAG